MTDNYDIFISYRRDGGAQYARILQLELEKRGYRVFPGLRGTDRWRVWRQY